MGVDAVELAHAFREVADDTATKVGDTAVDVSKDVLDTVGDAAAAAGDAVDDALDFGEGEKPVDESKKVAEN